MSYTNPLFSIKPLTRSEKRLKMEELQKELEKIAAERSKMQQQQALWEAEKERAREEIERQRSARKAVESELNNLRGAAAPPAGHMQPEVAQLFQQMTTILSQQSSQLAVVQNQPTTKYVSIGANETIRTFDATETPEQANAWLSELSMAKQIHGWPDELAYSLVMVNLKGAAQKWRMSKGETINSYESFVREFKSMFTRSVSKSERLKRMTQRVQAAKESIGEYFHDKVWLCQGLGLTDDEIKEEIAIGLWSKDMSNHILGKEYSTLDALYQDIQTVERIEHSRRERINARNKSAGSSTSGAGGTSPPRSNAAGSGSKNGNLSQGSTKVKEEEQKSKQPASEVKCYNCDENGHRSFECQKPKREFKCYKCNEIGHIAKNCEKPRRQSEQSIKMLNTNLNECTGEKYIRNIEIGGKSLLAFIDMGASVNTMRMSTVLLGEFKFKKDPRKIKAFGDSAVTSLGEVTESVIFEKLLPRELSFRVVPDDAQDTDVILGRPFTDAPDVAYHRVGNELIFEQMDESMFVAINEKGIKPVCLRKTKLEPDEVKFISTRFDNTDRELPVRNECEKTIQISEGQKICKRVCGIDEVLKMEMRVEPIVESEINVGDKVTSEQKCELVEILNDYRDCIANNLLELGKTNVTKMDVDIVEGAKPVSGKPFKLNMKDRADLNEIIDQYREAGIVTETQSEFASPAFVVRKSDGSARMVVDYRRLNKITKTINYPIPDFDSLLERLSGAKLFITLDLAQGYLQIPLTESAKEKTAFITEDQTGQFERAMFGLANAPKVFAKLMNKVLGPAQKKGMVFHFFDDICIYAKNWRELMRNLIEVLKALRDAGLTLNLKKCFFGMDIITYLGYVLGNGVIKPGERKIKAIEEYPVPTNVHEIRRFLGLAGFFRRFIPRYANITLPLTRLLRKNEPFVWKGDQSGGFEKVKQELVRRPALKIYNPKAWRTELHTDASSVGLAGMLLQADKEFDDLQLVYAVSKTTSEAEAKYHSSRLELMAIAWAVRRLRPFLIGIHFTIVTDCQCLINISAWKTVNPQMARWVSELAEYSFDVKHRPGQRMQHVDALSRAPVVEKEKVDEEKLSVMRIETTEDEILMFQRSDPDLSEKIDILNKSADERTAREKEKVKDYRLKDGLLYKSEERDGQQFDLYVIPKAMRKAMVLKYHGLSHHFGVEKTVTRMKQHYYFPKMRRYVKVHIRNCLECILAKGKSGRGEGELHPIEPGRRPFETIQVDHLGPFVSTNKNNKYLLVIMDNLTRFVKLKPVKNVEARTTVKMIEEFVMQFGAPERIISDRGTAFTGEAFKEMIQRHGIKHILISARHPQANGLVERMNRTILPLLRSSVNEEHDDWDQHIPSLERDINISVSAATGKAPFEAVFGYFPRFGEGVMRELTISNEVYRDPSLIQNEICENIKTCQEKMKARYDRNRCLDVKYDVGDIVFIKSNVVATGTSTKLQSKYKGPMVITRVLAGDTYQVEYLNKSRRQAFKTNVNVSDLKLWRGESCKDDELLEVSDSDDENNDNASGNESDVQYECRSNEIDTDNISDKENKLDEPKQLPKRVSKRPKYLEDFMCG